MIRVRRLFAVIIFCGLFIACSCGSRRGKAQDEPSSQHPVAGRITDSIRVSEKPEILYSMYIPGKGNSGQGRNDTNGRFPLIIAFDPHGSGVLPLTLYRDLADRYGFILAGSNNSRNGMEHETLVKIINGLTDELKKNNLVDSGRIYTMGFSGGARVATLAAMMRNEIRGVTGCGAGFPQGVQPPLYRFDYFGIAGTGDFNIGEMLQLDGILTQLGIRHYIRTFPGIHGWPPASVMEEAFLWTRLNEIKDGITPPDDSLADRAVLLFKTRILQSGKEGSPSSAADACREAIIFLDQVRPVDFFENELARIEKSPEYAKQVAYRKKILVKEEHEQQILMNALFTKDETWWRNRTGNMESSNMKGRNPEDTLMYARLRAFLSLLCYSNVSAAMNQQKWDMAEKLIRIYELADPVNPEPNYQYAVLLMQRGDSSQSLRQLGFAADKGFSDRFRINNQPEFTSIKSTTAWFDLMKKMK